MTPLVQLRRLCFALPEVSERLSHGEPTWFAGKKTFVMYANHHHDARLAFWCAAPDGAQDFHIRRDAGRFFKPPYVGVRGWVGVYLDVEVDWSEVGVLVDDAYRAVATKRQIALLDASSSPR